MKIFEKLRNAYTKLAEYLTRKQKPKPWHGMNLHDEVRDSFLAALRPVERRKEESKLGRTSWGKNWRPRNRAWLSNVVALPKRLRLPLKSPFLLEVTTKSGTVYLQRHGTLERADSCLPEVP